MPKDATYRGYEIHATSMPAVVQIKVSGKVVGEVQQGFSSHFAITLHKANESLDKPYSSNAVYNSNEEAEAAGLEAAKAIIDGKVKGIEPPR